MSVDFRLSSFQMLNITLGAESCPCSRDYEPLCEPVLWFTARGASQDHNTTPQPFLKYKSSAYWCHGISGSREDSTGGDGGQHSLESLHRCKTRQLTVSLIFCTTEIGMCHLKDTIFNSSDVLAVLKHDLQLSALTSPSVFNEGQGNCIMGETGTHKAVLREASLPGARVIIYMGTVGHVNLFVRLENISEVPRPGTPLSRKCILTVMR
jgi:hypothetical protein